MKILVFTSSRPSAYAVSLVSQLEAQGHRASFQSAPDFKASDGLEKCDAIWVEPHAGKQAEIEEMYLAAGAQLYEPEHAEDTRTPLERIEEAIASIPPEQHFADVTTLDDEAPVRIPVETPQHQPGRSRRKRGR